MILSNFYIEVDAGPYTKLVDQVEEGNNVFHRVDDENAVAMVIFAG